MVYLFAPMEGITFAQFRALHHELFPGASEYYTPFIAPDSKGSFKPKYLKELTSDLGVRTIPQLLVNSADSFNATAALFHEMGFDEINLNAGCPSGTVFSKHKGAGMLRDLSSLDRTLDGIFDQSERLGYLVSIKTRMGIHSTEEFPEILQIYNRYPVSRLIIHARCRDGLYREEPDISGFLRAAVESRCPAAYNGGIFVPADVERLCAQSAEVQAIMIGRGAVRNPAIFRELQGGGKLTGEELRIFHDRLTAVWLDSGLSPNYTMERMKTLWAYWRDLFPDAGKEIKAILKARRMDEYRTTVSVLFGNACFQ